MFRWRPLLLFTSAGFLLFGGCYEIPPIIPPSYVGGPVAPGWPPLLAYHRDPFHPRNRWFQRAFGGRDREGDLLPPHADEPLGIVAQYSQVDRAEMAALLTTILKEEEDGITKSPFHADGSREAVSEAIFRSDALLEASRIQSQGPKTAGEGELAALMLRVARGANEETGAKIKRLEETLPPEAEPPPLRNGDWLEADPAALASSARLPLQLFPSPGDLRWTRLLQEKSTGSSRPRSLLLRLRVALDERGEPLLLSLASECWELGGESARVWRFDRAEWLSGREPWHEAPEGAIPSIVMAPPAPAEAFSKPYVPVLDPRQRAGQEKLVKDALGPLLKLPGS